MRALNKRQKDFVDFYIETGNIYQSAIKAGYSEAYARGNSVKLMENMSIKAYLEERMSEIKSERTATAEEILEYLTSVLRGESESEVVVVENIGDYMSEARRVIKAPDEKERLKAAELLGKRYGLYTDKVQTEIDADINIKIDYGDKDEI